jgi:tetratricopeptide (TPR) repeat protein
MGEIWRAEQDKPISRLVAIKIIKAGMETKGIVARFETERQALAMMDHPCIAMVYDAGATDHGLPYFVMEYVRGVSITEHCDTHRLDTDARLNLFIQVCEGVQHAHQKAVIHRDIKPSNVLVTIQGNHAVPKIIDFGVAKATAIRLTDKTMFTEVGQMIGTPDYMSPEQAELTGQDIDTRTDIYSLGVLLYELLVGALPFDPKGLRKAGFDELRRKIREEEPLKPSTRISTRDEDTMAAATRRGTSPAILSRELSGDLDWIIMTAMAKDRTRRYASASDLIADIRRHQKNEPVLAGPPSTRYRLEKFIKRHRVGVAAAAVVALAVLLGIAGTTIGLVRAVKAERVARQEAEVARRVSDFLVGLFEVSDPNEARGNTITAREVLDQGAAKIGKELESQPGTQVRMMNTMGKVYQNLGLYGEAAPLLEHALELGRTLGDENPEVSASLVNLAGLYTDQAKYAQAESLLTRALAIREETAGGKHPDVAEVLHDLAVTYMRSGRYAEAESLYQETLAIQERALGPDHPDVARTLKDLAFLYQQQDRHDDAEALYRRALASVEKTLGSDHLDVARSVNNLAIVYFQRDKYDEAVPLYKRAVAIYEKVGGPEHPLLALTLNNLALTYTKQGRHADAEPLYRRALAIQEEVLGANHPDVGRTLNNLGNLNKDRGDFAAAEPLFLRALEIREKALGEGHPDFAWSLGDLGVFYRDRGEYDKAEPLFLRALSIFESAVGLEHSGVAWTLSDLGILCRERKDFVQAETYFNRAIATFEKAVGPDAPDLAECLENYAKLLSRMDRSQEAEALRTRAAAIRNKHS